MVVQFAEDRYNLEMNAKNLSQLNRAIIRGRDTGEFVLPKGTFGKVKLAPKNKPSGEAKEVRVRPDCPVRPLTCIATEREARPP